MAKGKINVVTDTPPQNRQKGKKYDPIFWEIDADVYGDLGIHRPFAVDKGQMTFKKTGWQVTNGTSGMRQVSFPTKAECIAYCKFFNEIAATNGAGGEWKYSKGLGRDYWNVNDAYLDAHNKAFRKVKEQYESSSAKGR